MSLSLNTTPTGIDPVYNPINFMVSATNSNTSNFKYIFDLYSGTTQSATTYNLLSTIKLNPRPNGSCQYNPARILESICSADLLIQNITGRTESNNEMKLYTLWGRDSSNSYKFSDNAFTSFGGRVGFLLLGPNPGFLSGQTIYIQQDLVNLVVPQYSGQHTIYTVTTGTSYSGITTLVVIDMPWISANNLSSGSISWTTGTTFFSGYTFNGVLQYIDYPSWNPTLYNALIPNGYSGSPVSFLTNQPRSGVYVRNQTDRGTASYMTNMTSSAGLVIVLIVHNLTGGTSINFISNTGGTLNTETIQHIPAGPWNLNQAVGSDVINENTSYYTIQVNHFPFPNYAFTEQLTYLMDQRCSKYQTVRLQFLNRLGGWDYVNFDMVSRKTINLTKRDTFKKNLNINAVVGDREKTLINIDGNYIYTVNSNWMNNNQSAWIEELFTSQNVNIINSDGTSWPVNILSNSLEIQKTINQKMISYSFELESAYQINAQRA